MVRTLTFAVGFAAGYAVRGRVVPGADHQPSAQPDAVNDRSSQLPDVQQWAGTLSSAASTVAGGALNAWRQGVAAVGATVRRRGATSAGAATAGGVIPLDTVPVDQLSDWELDLLTTPDTSQ